MVSVVLSIVNRPVQGLLCLVRVGVVGLVDIDEEPLLPVMKTVRYSPSPPSSQLVTSFSSLNGLGAHSFLLILTSM